MKTDIRFKQKRSEFEIELRKRVSNYFKSNSISKYANTEMILKTILMLTIFFASYGFIISGLFPLWINALLLIPLGFSSVGIATCIMHDANHGAYSPKKWVNDALGFLIALFGLPPGNWKGQHNILHHTYTNIEGYDPDIDVPFLLRFSEYQKYKKIHKYQYIYAPFLYSLQIFAWFWWGDYGKWNHFRKMGVHKDKKESAMLFMQIILVKLFYLTYMVAIPSITLSISWWIPLIGATIVQLIIGEFLTHIFVAAHVVDNVEMHNENEVSENEWFVHQLKTTTNFAPDAHVLGWNIGGLRFQIEHHLFRDICHVHYKKLSPIVKQTAEEFGLPYNVNPTLKSGLKAHYSKLKWLGTPESVF